MDVVLFRFCGRFWSRGEMRSYIQSPLKVGHRRGRQMLCEIGFATMTQQPSGLSILKA
jgi:hypothetical protein